MPPADEGLGHGLLGSVDQPPSPLRDDSGRADELNDLSEGIRLFFGSFYLDLKARGGISGLVLQFNFASIYHIALPLCPGLPGISIQVAFAILLIPESSKAML